MSSYLDYPRLHDIAAQLYADQLTEDQRFHLPNELDDAAVTNILVLLGQYPDVAKKPHGQARRNYNIQKAAGIDPGAYKVMKNVIRHLCHKHLDTDLSLTSQQQLRMNRLRLEAILAFPQLAKYDKQWPAVDLVRQYLENSASYRTKKATVTLKKQLAATERMTSQIKKTRKRSESLTYANMSGFHHGPKSAMKRRGSDDPALSTSDYFPSNPGSPQPTDHQPFIQGPSRAYDCGNQFYPGQYTYPPPPPMSDQTATQGWYGSYSYGNTHELPIPSMDPREVYNGNHTFSQPMSAP